MVLVGSEMPVAPAQQIPIRQAIPLFEIVFLGTSASAPSVHRGLSAQVVMHDEFRFLIDCGEGTQRQIMTSGLGFKRLNRILITHGHLDHISCNHQYEIAYLHPADESIFVQHSQRDYRLMLLKGTVVEKRLPAWLLRLPDVATSGSIPIQTTLPWRSAAWPRSK